MASIGHWKQQINHNLLGNPLVAEVRALYRDRWTVELLIAYNLIRLLMWHAAHRHGRALHRLSFTGTLHRVRAAWPLILPSRCPVCMLPGLSRNDKLPRATCWAGVGMRRRDAAAVGRRAGLANMKITWRRQTIHSRHPFHIARSGASLEGNETQRVMVRIENDGICGLGEAAPSAHYGQSCDSVEATLTEAATLLGHDPLRVMPIVDCLLERFADQTAAVAAIDMALYDWVGKKLGVPVWRLLGLDAGATPHTSYTIGLTEPEHLPARVANARGFGSLKLKVGTDRDEETLATVRRHAPHVGIRVDANGAWSPEEAPARIEALSRFRLEFVEQPIAPGQLEALAELGRHSPVPIIADEDCVRVADVVRLAGVVDGVNVKLAKCGGIAEALTMLRTARRLGMQVMLGCMIETSLGVSAAAQVASLADHVDLDGHLLLADDPFVGLVLADGIVRPADAPGLGITERAPAGP